MRSEAQIDYINHLEFMLDPHIGKLTKKVAVGFQALPKIYNVKVKAELPEYICKPSLIPMSRLSKVWSSNRG